MTRDERHGLRRRAADGGAAAGRGPAAGPGSAHGWERLQNQKPGHTQCQPANARLPRAIWLFALCRGRLSLSLRDVHVCESSCYEYHKPVLQNLHFAFASEDLRALAGCPAAETAEVLLPGVLAPPIGSVSLPVKTDASGGSYCPHTSACHVFGVSFAAAAMRALLNRMLL